MNSVHGNNWSALVPAAVPKWTPSRRVSICIPAHNPTSLGAVLQALSLQTFPSSLMEVVIADGGSVPPVNVTGDHPFPVSVIAWSGRWHSVPVAVGTRRLAERTASCSCSSMPTLSRSARSLRRTHGGSSIARMSWPWGCAGSPTWLN